MQNAVIQFSVKDKDLFGISNQYIADCFVLFNEIEHFDKQQQIHLKLNRPSTLGGLRRTLRILHTQKNMILLAFK